MKSSIFLQQLLAPRRIVLYVLGLSSLMVGVFLFPRSSEAKQSVYFTVMPSRQDFVFHRLSESFTNRSADSAAGFMAVDCSFQIAPVNSSFPANGGSGMVNVTANDSLCQWTAVSDVPWITITSATGVGSGAVNFSVSPANVARSGTLRLPDTQRIGLGVIVGQGNWEQVLAQNKVAYALDFVQRQRFITAFPLSMTADQFVTKLDENAGGVLSPTEKANLIAMLGGTPSDVTKRAIVLRAVAEDADLQQREFNRAFVLMQYFGYLRRNPNDPQDTDFRGWEFWLNKLNQFNGNFINAEMVKAFISSIEYRQRFAP